MPSLQPYSRELPYSYALGLYPVAQALRYAPQSVSRVLLHSRLGGGEGAAALLDACGRNQIRTEEADRLLRRLSGKDNCYAAAVFNKPAASMQKGEDHLVLVSPMDSGNLGTILRAALGFSYLDIALIQPCCDPFDPQVVRAAMGAHFSLRIREFPDFESYLNQAGRRALYPFMLSRDALALREAQGHIKSPHSLVFGNEGSGLPERFAGLGQAVRIEQSDRIDSLNLAVAAAIGMHSFHLG